MTWLAAAAACTALALAALRVGGDAVMADKGHWWVVLLFWPAALAAVACAAVAARP